jgi:hypothetical protein
MLKPPALLLQPDQRFSYLRHHDQIAGHIRELRIEDLYSDIEPLELDDSVPLEIRQHFDAARYAYLYAWFAYDLATLAELQAYSVLEMALRHKLKLELPHAKRSGLTALFKTAVDRKWLIAAEFDLPGSPHSKKISYFDVIVGQINKLMHGAMHLHPEGSLMMMKVCKRILNALFPVT